MLNNRSDGGCWGFGGVYGVHSGLGGMVAGGYDSGCKVTGGLDG